MPRRLLRPQWLGMSLPDYLFVSGDLGDALRGAEDKLGQAAEAIPADHALARSADELVAELLERFRVEPLILDWEATTAAIDDAMIDVGGDWSRGLGPRDGPVHVSGTKLTYHIPFVGERDLLKLRPSHFTFSPPRGVIGEHELLMIATSTPDHREALKATLEAEMAKVKTYVGHANADVGAFNERLEGTARQRVEERRAKVIGDRELVASLGVPVRRREDAATTYAVAPTRRIVTRTRGHRASPPEPVLSAETYEQVLGIARGMSVAMERSPKTFGRLNEEAIRDQFLVPLNGQYQGAATSETFNFEGKTDILIREKGRNVFIAECKFWGGPAKLSATVDQLLGYASWRDTQTAILLFNRGRSMTHVLANVGPTIRAHPSFVREIPYGGETDFRFVLCHRDDPERELTLTILAFEVPTG